MNNDKYLTITAITRYLKAKIDTDSNLRTVFLKGEISNFKSHSTGHLYFSLKDDNSKINAIMFASNAKKLTFQPIEGTKVLVMGRISIYEATGNYQIYIEEMLEDGVGNLYQEYEKLKKKLSAEGLFDESRKKKIPTYPKTIGVITSPTGAAIRDIISTIRRRYPICEIIVFPALVQGENAAQDIVEKLKLTQEYQIDTLIIGRGGGSIEDLWPFNEEIVARAIYNSKIPIISAVGHETDFTIADFVADMRAPTPTGAAEMAAPNLKDILLQVDNFRIRLNEAINSRINYQKLILDSIKSSYVIKNPLLMYEQKQQRIDNITETINNIIKYKLQEIKHQFSLIKNNYLINNPTLIYQDKIVQLNNILEKIELLNPMSILKRGYTLAYKNDRIIKSAKNLSLQDKIKLKFSDGTVIANIESVNYGKERKEV